MITFVIRDHADTAKRARAGSESYSARRADDPRGRENCASAGRQRFTLRQDRTWLKSASAPHAGRDRP